MDVGVDSVQEGVVGKHHLEGKREVCDLKAAEVLNSTADCIQRGIRKWNDGEIRVDVAEDRLLHEILGDEVGSGLNQVKLYICNM